MDMSREWTQRDYQKLWFTGNLREENNEAVPGEPEKMEYIQPSDLKIAVNLCHPLLLPAGAGRPWAVPKDACALHSTPED